jgi:hypothetical protein
MNPIKPFKNAIDLDKKTNDNYHDQTNNNDQTNTTISTKSVQFNPKVTTNYIEKTIKSNTKNNSYYNIHKHMVNQTDISNLSDPDQITDIDDSLIDDSLIDDSLINTDQTDVIDEDELEIFDEENFEIVEDETFEHTELLNHLFNTFLNKYHHLDNYKNKRIIYSMFKMAILHMPEHVSKPIFYLNFIESSINDILKSNINNFPTDDN